MLFFFRIVSDTGWRRCDPSTGVYMIIYVIDIAVPFGNLKILRYLSPVKYTVYYKNIGTLSNWMGHPTHHKLQGVVYYSSNSSD